MKQTGLAKEQIESIIEELYSDNQSKLRQICNKEMSKFGGISQMEYDNFYSRIGLELSIIRKRFEKEDFIISEGKTVKDYIYGAIKNSVWKEMTTKNRKKRQVVIETEEEDENGNLIKRKKYIPNVSIDAPVNDENNITIKDTLQSDFDMDRILIDSSYSYGKDIEVFLDSLSDMQRKMALLIMQDKESKEIQKILNITEKQYKECWDVITSYEKKRILYKENNMEEEKMDTVIGENVTEKYKNTSYSVSSISKQLKKKRIRDDHILQRHSGQWKGFAKSELISDILRGKSLTQIIISEEIKNSIKMQWLIDGKQRCTTIDDYLHDGFAISKNVKNYNITYQAPMTDEEGNEILNEDGFTNMKWKTFDIRGKKFSQLPEELQDIFKDRQIPVLYNMDCTKKDIADDIARFNRSRPMNKAQNGWLGLEESFAEFVENIAKMQFFQPEFRGSSYTKNMNTSGAIRRIIVESIMVSDFIDDFGDFDKMCEFLSEEASDSNFTEFYSLVERLTVIADTDNIAALFDAKDSFLWLGLFSRFSRLGISDVRFADFMNEFNSLRTKKIDGESFDDILQKYKSTKDKGIVVKKINHLDKLMNEFLCVEDLNESLDFIETFISENADDDIGFYEKSLDELEINTIKDDSRLLNLENRPSLLAMMVYSYKEEVDLDDWLIEYAKNNNTYFMDQKKNFLHMKNDFEQWQKENRKSA